MAVVKHSVRDGTACPRSPGRWDTPASPTGTWTGTRLSCFAPTTGSVTSMEKPHGWDETIADFRTLTRALAEPVAALMEGLAPEWSDRVVAKRILLSYPPGIGVGFRALDDELKDRVPEVDLSCNEGVYDVRLLNGDRQVVTADKCTKESASEVLPSFLLQLPD
jgi:hypothetical protein